jgi:N-acyl-D-amino-acid deacylase
VIDGSGSEGVVTDVGLEGDKVVAVADLSRADARRRIDAAGLIVAPGFVDAHSHSDLSLHGNRLAHSTIRQGVTTEVVGNCGMSNAPVSDRSLEEVRGRLTAYGYAGEVGWRSFTDYLLNVERGKIAQNVAFFVGHSAIRAAAGVVGDTPSAAELTAMAGHVAEAMEAGALGLSSGLEYDRGRWAGSEELRQLVDVVGLHGGCYASHIRNRDSRLAAAVDEFLDAVRFGRTAGQLSHLNVRDRTGAPDGAWDDAVRRMENARRSGLDVQADMTPFGVGLGRMVGLLPDWLLGGGYGEAAAALADGQVRQRLRHDCDRYWRFLASGEWDRARLLSHPAFPELSGRTFTQIADERHTDEWECFFDLLQAAGEGMGDLHMVGSLFSEEQLVEQLRHPLFSLGVDAYTVSADPAACGQRPSPLSFRGHIEYLAHHGRDKGYLSMPELIRKMTSMPAARFGIRRRGLLRAGYFADIVVFDLARVGSTSTWDDPYAYAEGIPYVLVNGSVVIDMGAHTGSCAGRVLRKE